jgi:two-component system chemotaxis response regulator CheY
MVAALEAGANEYVMKPFTREIIEDKLRLLGALQ